MPSLFLSSLICACQHRGTTAYEYTHRIQRHTKQITECERSTERQKKESEGPLVDVEKWLETSNWRQEKERGGEFYLTDEEKNSSSAWQGNDTAADLHSLVSRTGVIFYMIPPSKTGDELDRSMICSLNLAQLDVVLQGCDVDHLRLAGSSRSSEAERPKIPHKAELGRWRQDCLPPPNRPIKEERVGRWSLHRLTSQITYRTVLGGMLLGQTAGSALLSHNTT